MKYAKRRAQSAERSDPDAVRHALCAMRVALCALALCAAPAYAQVEQQLSLTWTDNSNNEDGFAIERGADLAGPFTEIARTAKDQASYVDPKLPSGTKFCYRVRAYNAAGFSGYSNVGCATTIGSPNDPTGLKVDLVIKVPLAP